MALLGVVLASISSATGGADGSDPITVGRGPGRYHGRSDLDATPVALAARKEIPPLRQLSSTDTEPSIGGLETGAEAGQLLVPRIPTLPEALIRATFGEHGEAALRIAECESGLRPDAVSYDGSSFGLFQLHAGTWAPVFPGFWEWWSDPQWNIEHAKIIYERAGGFWPWSCWR